MFRTRQTTLRVGLSSLLACPEYLANYKRDDSILILIDDDPQNLKDVRRLNEDVFLLKDTVLVDDTAHKLKLEINNGSNSKTFVKKI